MKKPKKDDSNIFDLLDERVSAEVAWLEYEPKTSPVLGLPRCRGKYLRKNNVAKRASGVNNFSSSKVKEYGTPATGPVLQTNKSKSWPRHEALSSYYVGRDSFAPLSDRSLPYDSNWSWSAQMDPYHSANHWKSCAMEALTAKIGIWHSLPYRNSLSGSASPVKSQEQWLGQPQLDENISVLTVPQKSFLCASKTETNNFVCIE